MIGKSKTKILVVIVLIIAHFDSYSQFHIEPTVSYNSFTMKDMKSILTEIAEDSPIKLYQVNEFPPFWGFGLEIMRPVNSTNISFDYGGVFQYTSSGSRLNISDYSGSLTYDMVVNRLTLGPSIRLMEKEKEKKYKMGIGASLLFSLSELNIAYKLEVYDLFELFSNRFVSESYQFKLSWIHHYNMTDKLYVLAQVGYELDFISSKLKYNGDKDVWLLNPDGSESRLDWSGFRSSLGLGFRLGN